MAEKKKNKSHKHSFFVPDDDHYTIDWLNSQTSLSVSIRILIHNQVASHGYSDMVFGSMATGASCPAETPAEAPQKPVEALEAPRAVIPPPEHFAPTPEPSDASDGPDPYHDENGDLDMDAIFGHH